MDGNEKKVPTSFIAECAQVGKDTKNALCIWGKNENGQLSVAVFSSTKSLVKAAANLPISQVFEFAWQNMQIVFWGANPNVAYIESVPSIQDANVSESEPAVDGDSAE